MKITLVLSLIILFASCSKESSTAPAPLTSADRTKFVGTWAGSYSCLGGAPMADTILIRFGGGSLDFSIVIHKHFANPDTVSGQLSSNTMINVPEQTMGGFPGTAQISLQGAVMTYSQSGFEITCGGTNYAKVP